MKTLEYTHAGRSGRLFVHNSASRDEIEATRALPYFSDDGDKRRNKKFARLFRITTLLTVTAVPAAESDEEVHLYVTGYRNTDELGTFACVVVSRSRLDELLEPNRAVGEIFTFQVADAAKLSIRAIGEAFKVWFRRNYPDVNQTAFVLVDKRFSATRDASEDGPGGVERTDDAAPSFQPPPHYTKAA